MVGGPEVLPQLSRILVVIARQRILLFHAHLSCPLAIDIAGNSPSYILYPISLFKRSSLWRRISSQPNVSSKIYSQLTFEDDHQIYLSTIDIGGHIIGRPILVSIGSLSPRLGNPTIKESKQQNSRVTRVRENGWLFAKTVDNWIQRQGPILSPIVEHWLGQRRPIFPNRLAIRELLLCPMGHGLQWLMSSRSHVHKLHTA
jgi:hypothetical protein